MLNLADKGWMLFPLESILQFPQGVLSPGVVYARRGSSPIPLFQKKMQIAIAFVPEPQAWIAGKCQPLLLYFGSTLLEDEQHLAAPKITALCSSAGPNHNSPEKLRLQTRQLISGWGVFNKFGPVCILPNHPPGEENLCAIVVSG